jgi:hypothetical protein
MCVPILHHYRLRLRFVRNSMFRRFLPGLATMLAVVGQPPPIPVEQRGLAIGASIPALSANDQNGRPRSLESLAGPKGLVLLFVRSADW